MPVFLALGNHDGREAFRATFADLDYWDPAEPFLQYVVKGRGLRLLVLDTHVPGKPSGALCPQRLGWLADRPAEDRETPHVVAMHHPTIAVGMPLMDTRSEESRVGTERGSTCRSWWSPSTYKQNQHNNQ